MILLSIIGIAAIGIIVILAFLGFCYIIGQPADRLAELDAEYDDQP
jgi:hypothetical protein